MDNEEWSEVDTTAPKEEKVEYEVEGEENEEDKVPSPVTAKEETPTEEAPKKEEPKELEGIETKGAQKRIRQLVKQRKERDEQLAQLMKQNEELNQPVQQQYQPQPTPDPRAAEWAQRNEWFGSDQVMTAASLAIDGQLKEEGFNPTDPEYYTEIDRRMQETFPHKFAANAAPVEEVRQQVEASKPAQVVAGASRSSPGSSKKVKLSKEDIRLANKWNIPLEQYALEKQKADKAEGEYTTVNMQRGGNK